MVVARCNEHGVVMRVWGNPAYVARRCTKENKYGNLCMRLLTIEEYDDAEAQ